MIVLLDNVLQAYDDPILLFFHYMMYVSREIYSFQLLSTKDTTIQQYLTSLSVSGDYLAGKFGPRNFRCTVWKNKRFGPAFGANIEKLQDYANKDILYFNVLGNEINENEITNTNGELEINKVNNNKYGMSFLNRIQSKQHGVEELSDSDFEVTSGSSSRTSTLSHYNLTHDIMPIFNGKIAEKERFMEVWDILNEAKQHFKLPHEIGVDPVRRLMRILRSAIKHQPKLNDDFHYEWKNPYWICNYFLMTEEQEKNIKHFIDQLRFENKSQPFVSISKLIVEFQQDISDMKCSRFLKDSMPVSEFARYCFLVRHSIFHSKAGSRKDLVLFWNEVWKEWLNSSEEERSKKMLGCVGVQRSWADDDELRLFVASSEGSEDENEWFGEDSFTRSINGSIIQDSGLELIKESESEDTFVDNFNNTGLDMLATSSNKIKKFNISTDHILSDSPPSDDLLLVKNTNGEAFESELVNKEHIVNYKNEKEISKENNNFNKENIPNEGIYDQYEKEKIFNHKKSVKEDDDRYNEQDTTNIIDVENDNEVIPIYKVLSIDESTPIETPICHTIDDSTNKYTKSTEPQVEFEELVIEPVVEYTINSFPVEALPIIRQDTNDGDLINETIENSQLNEIINETIQPCKIDQPEEQYEQDDCISSKPLSPNSMDFETDISGANDSTETPDTVEDMYVTNPIPFDDYHMDPEIFKQPGALTAALSSNTSSSVEHSENEFEIDELRSSPTKSVESRDESLPDKIEMFEKLSGHAPLHRHLHHTLSNDENIISDKEDNKDVKSILKPIANRPDNGIVFQLKELIENKPELISLKSIDDFNSPKNNIKPISAVKKGRSISEIFAALLDDNMKDLSVSAEYKNKIVRPQDLYNRIKVSTDKPWDKLSIRTKERYYGAFLRKYDDALNRPETCSVDIIDIFEIVKVCVDFDDVKHRIVKYAIDIVENQEVYLRRKSSNDSLGGNESDSSGNRSDRKNFESLTRSMQRGSSGKSLNSLRGLTMGKRSSSSSIILQQFKIAEETQSDGDNNEQN